MHGIYHRKGCACSCFMVHALCWTFNFSLQYWFAVLLRVKSSTFLLQIREEILIIFLFLWLLLQLLLLLCSFLIGIPIRASTAWAIYVLLLLNFSYWKSFLMIKFIWRKGRLGLWILSMMSILSASILKSDSWLEESLSSCVIANRIILLRLLTEQLTLKQKRKIKMW